MKPYSLLLLVVLCCLVGCSAKTPHLGEEIAPPPEAAQLWSLRIVHDGKPRFSGIMGMEPKEQGVYCVVLDATGLPLVEGVVVSPTDMEVTRCIDELAKRRFPELISRVVGALFLTPHDAHCAWYRWGCAVRSVSGDGTGELAEYRLGPFTGWQAAGSPQFRDARELRVSFPWQGVDVYMKRMGEE